MSASKKKFIKAQIDKKVSRILAQSRREPRFRVQRERTALIDAIRYGRPDIAQSLLANGVAQIRPSRKGGAPMVCGVLGTKRFDSRFGSSGAALPDDVLMGPVHDGDVGTVRFLIKHGANVNCVATFTRYSSKFPQKNVLLTLVIQSISAHEIASSVAAKIRKRMTHDEDWELIPSRIWQMRLKDTQKVADMLCINHSSVLLLYRSHNTFHASRSENRKSL